MSTDTDTDTTPVDPEAEIPEADVRRLAEIADLTSKDGQRRMLDEREAIWQRLREAKVAPAKIAAASGVVESTIRYARYKARQRAAE